MELRFYNCWNIDLLGNFEKIAAGEACNGTGNGKVAADDADECAKICEKEEPQATVFLFGYGDCTCQKDSDENGCTIGTYEVEDYFKLYKLKQGEYLHALYSFCD